VHFPGDRGGTGPGGDDADRFLAEQVVEHAVSARRRERLLRDRLVEASTLPGVLAASVGDQVTLGRIDGVTRSGTLEVVGQDVVALRHPGGVEWWAVAHLVTVVTSGPTPGAGPAPRGLDLASLLADLVDHDISVIVMGGREHRGRLIGAGGIATLAAADGVHRIRVDAISALIDRS
jgi:hypothetical protein